jgi:TolA-binding protein
VEVTGPGSGHFAVHAGQHFRASLADGSLRVENLDTGAPALSAGSAAAAASAVVPTASASPSSEGANPADEQPPTHEESWSALVRHRKFQQVVSAAHARGVDACLSGCSASDLRALADAARYSGKLGLAESSLLALRRRFKGTGAAAAAFLLGRISESRGQLAAANRWYEFSSQEAPRGEFAADALAGRMRAVAATQGTSSARPLAEQYLDRYPEGVHARAAKKIVGLK